MSAEVGRLERLERLECCSRCKLLECTCPTAENLAARELLDTEVSRVRAEGKPVTYELYQEEVVNMVVLLQGKSAEELEAVRRDAMQRIRSALTAGGKLS